MLSVAMFQHVPQHIDKFDLYADVYEQAWDPAAPLYFDRVHSGAPTLYGILFYFQRRAYP